MKCPICCEKIEIINDEFYHSNNSRKCSFQETYKIYEAKQMMLEIFRRNTMFVIKCRCNIIHSIEINENDIVDIQSDICDIAIFTAGNLKCGININTTNDNNFYMFKYEDIKRVFKQNSLFIFNYSSCSKCNFFNRFKIMKLAENLEIISRDSEYRKSENILSILVYGKLRFYKEFSIGKYETNIELWKEFNSMNRCIKCLNFCITSKNNPYCQKCNSYMIRVGNINLKSELIDKIRVKFHDLYQSVYCLFSDNVYHEKCRMCELYKSRNIFYDNRFINLCCKCIYFYIQEDKTVVDILCLSE